MPPIVYLSASIRAQPVMRRYRDILQDEFGWKVQARWIDVQESSPMGVKEVQEDRVRAAIYAVTDMADILTSGTVIIFTRWPSTSGGRHTELGLALAFGKRIILVGPRENVFQALPDEQFRNWADFLTHLRSENATTPRNTENPYPTEDGAGGAGST